MSSLKTLPETFAETKAEIQTLQTSEKPTDQPNDMTVKDLEEIVSQKRAELSTIQNEIEMKETEIAELRKEVDEEHIILAENRKVVEDFAVVKAEIAATGIEPSLFSNVITAFKKYNYNCGDILSGYAEVMDINEARAEIKRQKQKIEKQQETLNRRLEEINDPYAFQTVINTLGINRDQLMSSIRDLMTYWS